MSCYVFVPRLIQPFLISVVIIVLFGTGRAAWAEEAASVPMAQAEKARRANELKGQLQKILDELDELERQAEPPEAPKAQPAIPQQEVSAESAEVRPELHMEDISIISRRILKRPAGVAQSTAPRSELTEQPTRHFRESLESLPGIVVRQGNGPRDFNISIRGSGAKTAFGIRNIKMYEDGISQTQSDGLSRLDLHDPWFMEHVEVLQGPSSSLYDNYALGGVVHFKTRRGRDIGGVETLFSGGSWGFHKEAIAVGKEYTNLDASLFASYAREDGFIQHSDYNTATVNLNLRFRIDDKQNFYFKAINNDLDTHFPTRLTLSQFQANPRQQGGTATSNPDSLFQKRRDRRTIIGGLYERQIDANTILITEADYDVKDINQYTFQIGDNVNPNFKHYTDLRHDGTFLGRPLRSSVGFFFNYMEQEGNSFRNLNDFNGTRGSLAANTRVTIRNIGARFREEWEFIPRWTLAAGFGYESSLVSGQVANYSTTGTVTSRTGVSRTFNNYAPEVSLIYEPRPEMRHWTRVSTGYAIPGIGNLTTGLDGLPGPNFDLKPQKNLSVEIGTESRLHRTFMLHLVGFWTFFKDEIITQTTSLGGGATGTFSVNADSSEYRGVELGWIWLPADGWRVTGAYTHIDAKYINFQDQFVVGGVTTKVTQDGKQVPAVEKNVLNAKVAYDHPSGLGAWGELSWIDSFFVNNANTLATPAYILVNFNIHHVYPLKHHWIRFIKTYAELDNAFDKIYVASAVPVADNTPDAFKQAFFAGYGRSFYAGVTLGF